MPFTVHPEQKPSEDEKLWTPEAVCARAENAARAAAVGCHAHAENVRAAKALGILEFKS